MSVLACGWSCTFIVSSDNSLWCFGTNESGQLGLGDREVRSTWTRNPTQNIIAIACGYTHNLCIDIAGNVWSFGGNEYGQLGLGDSVDRLSPERIETFQNSAIVSVACGGYCSFSVDHSGHSWSFGENVENTLTLGIEKAVKTPQQMPLLNDIKFVSAQSRSALFLTSKYKVYACGQHMHRKLGVASSSEAMLVPTLSNVSEISAGQSHALCVTLSGEVYCFGYNGFGQLGLGNRNHKFAPTIIPNLPPIISASCGLNYSLFLDCDGHLWGCGENSAPELGVSAARSILTPIRLPTQDNICIIGSSMRHFCIRSEVGDLFLCGTNSDCQLGFKGKADGFFKAIIPFNLSTPSSRAKSARK